jgi:triphosphoribosyl-dephospho-CoA synthase
MTVSTPSPGRLAQIACIFEASARKPGNVHRLRDFSALSYLDFLLSAAMIAEPLDRSWSHGIGQAALDAVRETRKVVDTNTNLGMILLLAPLAAVSVPVDLRQGVKTVLKAASVHDARLVYEAIRLAEPGGLGHAPDQDVRGEPTLTLVEVMRLAADRDLVARQYVNSFAEVFDLALPALRRGLEQGLGLEGSIIHAHLSVLAERPDSLIERKCGAKTAAEASRRASLLLAGPWPREGLSTLGSLDAFLTADGNARNPGTTADLVTAAIFAGLRDGLIPLPRDRGPAAWYGQA